MQKKGETLTADQKEAVRKFDEVRHSLDLAKEFCKQFSQIAKEANREAKRESKRVRNKNPCVFLFNIDLFMNSDGIETMVTCIRIHQSNKTMLDESLENICLPTCLFKIFFMLNKTNDSLQNIYLT